MTEKASPRREPGAMTISQAGEKVTSIFPSAAYISGVSRAQIRAGLALAAMLAPEGRRRDDLADRRLDRAERERDLVLAAAHHLVGLHTADEIQRLAERDRAHGCSEADLATWRAWWQDARHREDGQP